MKSELTQSLLAQCDELNNQLAALLSVASDLASELDFKILFPLIVTKISDAMKAERTSLYLLDQDRNELWTKAAEGISTIRVPVGEGISGRVARTGEMLNIEDAWKLSYFNREFDHKNNFRTRSVLCMPIKNHNGDKIGVLQVINKKTNADLIPRMNGSSKAWPLRWASPWKMPFCTMK